MRYALRKEKTVLHLWETKKEFLKIIKRMPKILLEDMKRFERKR